MKKIMYIITSLILILTINSVKAENIKVGNATYLYTENITCNGTVAFPLLYIAKSNKIIAMTSSDILIWAPGNVCSPMTTQDFLDMHNSQSEYTQWEDDSNVYTYGIRKYETYTKLIKATSYDEDKSYFNENGTNVTASVNSTNYSDYYVKEDFKYPDKAEVNQSITYYKSVSDMVVAEANISEVSEEPMTNFYVKVTDSKTDNIKDYTMPIDIYNNIMSDASFRTYRTYNGVQYMRVEKYDNETDEYIYVKYYDFNGTEITKYRNIIVEDYENYMFIDDVFNHKITVTDKATNKEVFKYEYGENDSIEGTATFGDIAIIYGIFDGEDKYLYLYKYEVLEGDNQIFSNKDITIRFNGNFNAFKELKINDKVVDPKYYTVKEGSTIITLSKTYLDTLVGGTYTVTAVYTDSGEASATFNIPSTEILNETKDEIKNETETVKDNTPETSDNIYLYIILGLISISGLALITKKYI